MSAISFETELFSINGWVILRLAPNASSKLPSRGMVMVSGLVNGVSFQSPLEPDGRHGHWLHLDNKLLASTGVSAGDTVNVELEPTKIWADPKLPDDVHEALHADTRAYELWMACTPMARWDWLRWIGGTSSEITRANHIVVAISKLKGGHRRPCCFNRSACTTPEVSKNGVLLEPVGK